MEIGDYRSYRYFKNSANFVKIEMYYCGIIYGFILLDNMTLSLYGTSGFILDSPQVVLVRNVTLVYQHLSYKNVVIYWLWYFYTFFSTSTSNCRIENSTKHQCSKCITKPIVLFPVLFTFMLTDNSIWRYPKTFESADNVILSAYWKTLTLSGSKRCTSLAYTLTSDGITVPFWRLSSVLILNFSKVQGTHKPVRSVC